MHVTLTAAACLPRLLGRRTMIDHMAHLGGYACGLCFGLLLAPCVPRALSNYRAMLFDRMEDSVAEGCGLSGIRAEAAVRRYLEQITKERRRRTLNEWTLEMRGSKLRERTPPDTEIWPQVSPKRGDASA
ncbi:MAG: hypothetical protein SGPRY_004566 [Prymnesium sp.]